MGRAAARGADFVVVTNDNPRSEDPESIARAIVAGMEGAEDRLVVLLDREKAIQHCVLAAHPGDVVLVAGKGHETYQVVGEETLEFDDRVVARRALTVRRGGGSA